MEKHPVSPENAAQIKAWIAERGGLALWQSINLSNPGASWTTPLTGPDGQPTPKPSWQAASTPARIITDPAEVEVVTAKEVKRFRVAVVQKGLRLDVSDGGTRRIRAAVAKAGPEAWYAFDYETQEAVIFVPGRTVPLTEWTEGV